MATVIKNESINCPCCGIDVDVKNIERRGLNNGILNELDKQIRDGILEETFSLAKALRRVMDPSATRNELVMKEELMKIETSLRKQLIPMSKTIAQLAGGTGKGDVAELRITEALRQFYSQDEFDTTSAHKGGSDSIAKVCDKKIEVGKITISVKDTKKWNSEFKTQIEKNMVQDSTKFGILISETLPKGTNETGEVVHSSNGGMYFLVHPKYATALYSGIRQSVIYMHETDQDLRSKEKELMQLGNISQALSQWISGDERKQFQLELNAINEDADETIQGLQKTRTYVEREVKKACDRQTSIKRHVLNQEGSLRDLTDMLKKSGEENHA
ncbi:MAG: DUF2130 domain-containing protein [Thaumarchaeota archaeon]|nr:DUF2130 domain-containing protein [Nitrososphaerota archaeon]